MDSTLPDRLPSIMNEAQRRRDMLLRTLPISLLPVFGGLITGLLLHFFLGGPPPAQGPAGSRGAELLVGLAVAVILFSALLVIARLGRPTISALLFISLWTLLTTLATLQNGVTTFWPALLLLPICAAGLLLDGVASAILALLDTLLISVFAVFEWQGGSLAPPQTPPFLVAVRPFVALGFWIAVFWSVAALTWLLAGSLQRALAQSRAQAAALRELSAGLEARVATQTAELAKRAERAEALHEVSRALTNTLDLPEVLDLITEQAARLLRFESALVLLAQPDAAAFTLIGAYHPPVAVSRVLAAAEPSLRAIVAEGRAQLASLPLDDDSRDAASSSALVLPMRYGTAPRGVLVLMDSATSAARGKDDLALAEGLADQAAVAIANAQMVAQLHESATLEERTRLAREIHDTLAQGLTGIVVQLSAAGQSLIDAPGQVTGHLDLAQRMAREALAEARRSVWNLRAPALQRGDLADALRSLAARPARNDISITFDQRGEPWQLSPAIESALLRVCQEALANVAKHAEATHASVVLEYTAEAVALQINDNGIGFDINTTLRSPVAAGPWGGFGLLGMRERLAALGGTLEIRSEGGTHVRALVPRPGIERHDALAPLSLQARVES
jgi:signal transduction histidine kinase